MKYIIKNDYYNLYDYEISNNKLKIIHNGSNVINTLNTEKLHLLCAKTKSETEIDLVFDETINTTINNNGKDQFQYKIGASGTYKKFSNITKMINANINIDITISRTIS